MPFDWSIVNTAVTAVIAGVIVLFVQSRITALQRETTRLQDARRQVYLKVLEPVARALAAIANPAETDKAIEQITSFDHRLVMLELNLIGSDEVIRASNRFMQDIFRSGETSSPLQVMQNWSALLLAIRKDLGSRRTKLKGVDMLRSQITDIDQFLST